MMEERKLATIRQITNLKPIDGADLIEVASVDGWNVVVKKGEHSVGDYVVYLEIDSWVPDKIAPFLTPEGHFPKTYKGIEGQRLKTRKLRGQISQGLIISLADIDFAQSSIPTENGEFVDGADLTDLLSIIKWEPEEIGRTGGVSAGNFPSHLVRKTDAERVQNKSKYIRKLGDTGGEIFFVTEKLDGTSFTACHDGTEAFVCSRNLKVKDEGDSLYWKVAKENNLIEFLDDNAANGNLYAIQGEIIGPGIQKNKYDLRSPELYIFNIWDIKKQQYLSIFEMTAIALNNGWKTVPTIKIGLDYHVKIGNQEGFVTVEDLLKFAEGKSLINPRTEREGVVFWPLNTETEKMKAISNKWLMKNG